MSLTSKGARWEWLHSLWIIWTLTFGFFNWIAFFYIGARVKQRKWVIWGVIYAVPFVLMMIFEDKLSSGALVGDIIAGLWLLMWIVSIVHAIKVRREYLIRLEAMITVESREDSILRQNLALEYGLSSQDRQAAPASAVQPASAAQPASTADQAQVKVLDINKATEQEIAELAGVGVILAKKAMEFRKTKGSFSSLEEFGQVLDLKPHIIERLKPWVTFSKVNVNKQEAVGRILDI